MTSEISTITGAEFAELLEAKLGDLAREELERVERDPSYESPVTQRLAELRSELRGSPMVRACLDIEERYLRGSM